MEVWQTSNLRPLRLGEEKKERKKDRNHRMKIYMVSLLHRATIININIAIDIACLTLTQGRHEASVYRPNVARI